MREVTMLDIGTKYANLNCNPSSPARPSTTTSPSYLFQIVKHHVSYCTSTRLPMFNKMGLLVGATQEMGGLK